MSKFVYDALPQQVNLIGYRFWETNRRGCCQEARLAISWLTNKKLVGEVRQGRLGLASVGR